MCPACSGVTFAQFNGETLWVVPPKFKDAVEDLLRKNLDCPQTRRSPDSLREPGFGDFLPRWSAADIQTALKDGKIPVYATWKDRLASGKIGLDALMNLSALYSFATDQKASTTASVPCSEGENPALNDQAFPAAPATNRRGIGSSFGFDSPP